MASEQSLWFRIGYALELAKHPFPSADKTKKLTGLAKRARKKVSRGGEGKREREREGGASLSTDDLVSAGLVMAAGKLLDVWRPRREARFSQLLRAAIAGAGAALLLDLVRPLLAGTPAMGTLDRETGARLLAGAGQGLLYGTIVEPRLPGPPLLNGALFGSAEYAADPAGGLSQLVGAHAPLGRLPLVGDLLENLDPRDRSYVEHLTFGIALALLYGSSPSSNGMLVEDDDE